ncbi:MAG: hypothetical protein A3F72_07755 [Bacteroidetes bacterium RIFCSPLOWO2_12_FULL_35_15]|nr:MAG: hypothetical protein A3F72_07755 [Bacteroidetes bacterium RIFCSPLOWO2_12_FULL_35_15]
MKATKLISQILFVSLFFVLTNGCKKKEEENPIAEMTTRSVSYVSHNGAFCGGAFTTETNNSSAQGICWSTSESPTISDSHSEEMYGSWASGGGSYDVIINNLLPGTTYHVRAYCTNVTGTGYGNDVSFTTLAIPPTTVADTDGNVYNTLVIGNQVWLDKNLNVVRYANGDSISLWTDPYDFNTITTEKYMNAGNSPTNAATYGRLYNFYAASDTRKITPAGWHVPSQEEWDFLGKYLGGYNVAGGKMKETGLTHWASPNTGATNSAGFKGIPSSIYSSAPITSSVGYWSSSVYDDGSYGTGAKRWTHSLGWDTESLGSGNDEKYSFMAIRLVRDYAQ